MNNKLTHIIFLFLYFFITHSIAEVRYVSKTGSNEFPYLSWETAADSIQTVLNICEPGDTVYVANGIYEESLIVNEEIHLIGSSMDSCVIKGTGLAVKTIYIKATCYIQNFKIIGKGVNIDAQAVWAEQYLEIDNCRITEAGIGIVIIASSSKSNHLFIDNVERGYDAGCLGGGCTNYLLNSTIIISQGGGSGMRMSIGGDYFIENNIFLYTGPPLNNDNGIIAGWPRRILIKNNFIYGFINGIFIDLLYDSAFVYNNVSAYNRYSGLRSSGENVVAKYNIFYNNEREAVR